MTSLTVWAPAAATVGVDVDGQSLGMARGEGGWWSVEVPAAGHGTRYAFRVDGGDPRPDPRSRWQPDGVHAASAVYSHERFSWTDDGWAGIDPADAVVYETHVGTFTERGTLDSGIDRLPHLVELGVTVVELLPVAAFDGTAGWGYDGVDLHAVHEPYGGPDALKRFVDAAHGLGLAVCLDVVYNHFGPSGNYVASFGPYFTDRYATPWGEAVNLDGAGSDEIRAFILTSALQWLRDYHLDGLRLDATHALFENGRALPVLEELAAETDELSAATGQRRWLVAENDTNNPGLTARRAGTAGDGRTPLASGEGRANVVPGEGRATVVPGEGGTGVHAQWDDDVHHALHALVTGESAGYYADFAVDPYAAVAKVATRVFFHDGTWSQFRQRVHGRAVDPAATDGARFWAFLQNHDQIGNRAVGDRQAATVPPGRLAAGAAVLFALPFVPMVFMGEEWAAGTPWQFFTSFADPALGDAVRTGRRSEFAGHGWDVAEVPDPQSPQTVVDSRLDWSELEQPDHRRMYEWYRTLIGVRKSHADLGTGIVGEVEVRTDRGQQWLWLRRGSVLTVAAFGESGALVALPPGLLPTGATATVLAAWDPATTVTDGTVQLSGAGAAVLALG